MSLQSGSFWAIAGATLASTSLFTSKEQLPQKKKLGVYDFYFGFAISITLASGLPFFIPVEYRRRWGIEAVYRVQGNVEAKTTSRKYVLRLLYQMTSVLVYNVWQYANLLLCRAVKKPFDRPLLKLASLAVHLGFHNWRVRAASTLNSCGVSDSRK